MDTSQAFLNVAAHSMQTADIAEQVANPKRIGSRITDIEDPAMHYSAGKTLQDKTAVQDAFHRYQEEVDMLILSKTGHNMSGAQSGHEDVSRENVVYQENEMCLPALPEDIDYRSGGKKVFAGEGLRMPRPPLGDFAEDPHLVALRDLVERLSDVLPECHCLFRFKFRGFCDGRLFCRMHCFTILLHVVYRHNFGTCG